MLTQWAEYLKEKGFDPENQLCTDDFAGHLAHNVNLSAKAIVALGPLRGLAEQRGDTETAKSYRELARSFAVRWVKEADDGDHFRLAFDQPGTWSQKYNLVWDRILGLGLFPQEVVRKGDGPLQDGSEPVRPAAGQSVGLHEAGLGGVDGLPDRRSRRLRGAGRRRWSGS